MSAILSPVTRSGREQLEQSLRLAAAVAALLIAGLYAALSVKALPGLSTQALWFLVIAAAVGAYMAMNIGANDVANNMGPPVGSGAISLGGAIVLAAIFEALGAIVAGADVVGTIKGGIIEMRDFAEPERFTWLMLAALLAGALWLNVATVLGAPVSTTHSIIGAVAGAGIAAGGWAVINWGTIGAIVASWIVSPLFGGAVAAAVLYITKRTITYQADMAAAAGRRVPLLIAAMAWAFATYMLLKGLNNVVKVGFWQALLAGFGVAVLTFWVVRGPIARHAATLPGTKAAVNELFTWPLVFAAALLSFAHGANDVANAIGPLAAIYEAVLHGAVVAKAATPLWILILGALGLSVGLALYGGKLIMTVGKEITELDRMRAYAIAMAATVTVILASQLGMPVSTTHVSIGAVFGVGFLRELLKVNYAKMEAVVRAAHQGEDREAVEAYLVRFEAAPVEEKKRMLAEMKRRAKEMERRGELAPGWFSKKERKAFKKAYKQEIVKRSVVLRIVAAWIVTVPATALLAALLFRVVELLLTR
ncbi:inorganic phosphate transporter [Tepidimonas taiwanensis]|uniref:Phosphate transporter n=1 Tax=Tepidimonas taiwanensis TaxID=307486 RepID=A0A554XD42_9BURK|nr:inorganic phosphate transporter [Tepidimonas taiwanensis]MCX7692215.1 inorganic phosphate transporter [Tepidimonas taiwanensis]MDM7462145.1 inorganic phosphate transporter [Tepidimonas taiwanensis]TSE33761.1 Sulfate permease CysP [Tepidimonas taiwanensis]UBQ06692.1 inorganic phosphate transporter [Tepidimonas taiwanensis]